MSLIQRFHQVRDRVGDYLHARTGIDLRPARAFPRSGSTTASTSPADRFESPDEDPKIAKGVQPPSPRPVIEKRSTVAYFERGGNGAEPLNWFRELTHQLNRKAELKFREEPYIARDINGTAIESGVPLRLYFKDNSQGGSDGVLLFHQFVPQGQPSPAEPTGEELKRMLKGQSGWRTTLMKLPNETQAAQVERRYGASTTGDAPADRQLRTAQLTIPSRELGVPAQERNPTLLVGFVPFRFEKGEMVPAGPPDFGSQGRGHRFEVRDSMIPSAAIYDLAGDSLYSRAVDERLKKFAEQGGGW